MFPRNSMRVTGTNWYFWRFHSLYYFLSGFFTAWSNLSPWSSSTVLTTRKSSWISWAYGQSVRISVCVVVQFFPWLLVTLPNLVPRSHSVLYCEMSFSLGRGRSGYEIIHYHTQKQRNIKIKLRMKLNNNIRLVRLVVYDGLLVFWNFVWGHVLTEQEGGSRGHQVQQRWICLSIPGQVKLQLVLSHMRGEWARARLRLTPLEFDN